MKTRTATYIYNAVWFVCFCWFIWSCFHAIATAPKGSGVLALAQALAIGAGPMYILWAWKRWYTGKWFS